MFAVVPLAVRRPERGAPFVLWWAKEARVLKEKEAEWFFVVIAVAELPELVL